jgi:hypothetical protein
LFIDPQRFECVLAIVGFPVEFFQSVEEVGGH